MSITLDVSEPVMQELEREAAKQGMTTGELAEAILQAFLMDRREKQPLPPLPSFDSGGARVDICNRELLYDFMEEQTYRSLLPSSHDHDRIFL